jgi:ArsR family transcriptional regulator
VHLTDGVGTPASPNLSTEEISRFATEPDELEQIAREPSLAQRWVQGRIEAVRDALSETADANEYLDAEVLVTVVRGARQTSEIASELDLPSPVVEESLARLAEDDIIRRVGDGWQLT